MKQQPMGPILGPWFKGMDTNPPDAQDCARMVMARLPEIRQRGRWWPLPVFHRKVRAKTPTTDDMTVYQPSPIPATNGRGPFVIGRTYTMFSPVKAIIAGALVFALGGMFLVAQPFDQQDAVPGAEQDESDPLAPAFVTGDLTDIVESNQTEVEIADDVLREAWDATARLEMDDPRLSGTWSATLGINNYHPRLAGDEFVTAAETYTGSVAVTNDGGTWVGTMLGISGVGDTDTPDTQMVELVGSGGYEGLSVLLFATEGSDEGVPFYGVIVVGDLVLEPPTE